MNLSAKPFYLSKTDIKWVEKTRDAMTTEDKVRQLFIHISVGDDLNTIAEFSAMKPAGLHRFMGSELEPAWKATRQFIESCNVPPFISGDIEGGGHGSAAMLQFPNNLGLAAANDPKLSSRLLQAVCTEAKALGFNWSFTPCVDINFETQSAIVSTRSYGSHPKRIAAQAKTHIAALQKNSIAATAKHWPGEGFAARDQHLVTTVNPLTMKQWHKTFGKLYAGLIEQGVLSVMSAHIALPAYMKGKSGLEKLRPASINKRLNVNLLRKELGFNGLIVSDATPMGGLVSYSTREQHVPEVIENGCDVFLFSRNPQADLAFMLKGLKEKRLTEKRLDEAVTRILALKATLGLHRMTIDERIAPWEQVSAIVKTAKHIAVATEAAEKSITLVKDVNKLLPISPVKHKRITLIDPGSPNMFERPSKPMSIFSDELRERGFEISAFDAARPPSAENTDLLLYVMATESSLGLSHIHIDWKALHQTFNGIMARFWHDVPTMMISFGHPYYLRDAPRIPCLVNAYSTVEAVQRAAASAICSPAKMQGSSPVDAFADAADARY